MEMGYGESGRQRSFLCSYEKKTEMSDRCGVSSECDKNSAYFWKKARKHPSSHSHTYHFPRFIISKTQRWIVGKLLLQRLYSTCLFLPFLALDQNFETEGESSSS
jgi:hypothetical protein